MDNIALIVLGVGGVAAVIILIVGIVVSISSDRSEIDERLQQVLQDGGSVVDKEEDAPAKTPLTDMLNDMVQGSNWAEKISKNLARADIRIKPGEYFALMIIASFATGFFSWFIGGMSIIPGVIGAVIGIFLPGFYVKRAQGQRLQKFNDQLGDMLNLMVNGLRAGYSVPQAMEAVSKEMPSPLSDEFKRVVQEMTLGVPMPQALDNLLRRIPSEDLDLIITAVNVQREVGGNLAEILDTISHTIRERVRIKGEIKTLTTQVMYSGQFLALMPVALLVALFFFNRDYMMQFFIERNNWEPPYPIPCGYCALAIGAGLIVAGYFAMRKIGDIEV